MHLLQDDQKQFSLSLTSLITLEEAELPGGAFAIRELDQKHVEQLALSNPGEWPAVKVTRCNLGYILIDGYHRRQAASQLHLGSLLADCTTYMQENDVIEEAFRSNLTHVLKASLETKSDYAYWLHLTYPQFRQEEIAKRVGITQSVVSKAIARREARLAEEHEDTPAQNSQQIVKTCRSFTRFALKFLSEIEENDSEAVIQTLNAVAKNDRDREKIAKLGELLSESAYPLREHRLKTVPLSGQ